MLLPTDFKQVIADTFYDKTITKLNVTENNVDGWVSAETEEGETFNGNVRFRNLGELQSELGLVEPIDIAVTCGTDVQLGTGDRFIYGGKQYGVSVVLPFDSHLLAVGRKWQSS